MKNLTITESDLQNMKIRNKKIKPYNKETKKSFKFRRLYETINDLSLFLKISKEDVIINLLQKHLLVSFLCTNSCSNILTAENIKILSGFKKDIDAIKEFNNKC